ncbi:MAG: hypothetical protein AAFQ98_18365 [Bacteroidota bacterium]
MKRTLTFCFLTLLCLSPNLAAGQSSTIPLVDSLQGILGQTSDVSSKIPLLIELSGALSALQPDSSLQYAQEAFSLALSLGDQALQAEAVLKMVPYYLQTSQYAKSDSLLGMLQPLATETTDASLLGSYYHAIGINAQYQKFYSEAIQAYLKALEYQEPFAEPKDLIADYVNIGSLIARRGRLEVGIDYMMQAYGLAQANGYPLVQIEYNIAQAYTSQQVHDSAWHYAQKALVSARREATAFGEFKAYEILPVIGVKAGYPDSALVYARKGLAIAQETGNPRIEYAHRLNLVYALNGLERPEEALREYEEAQKLGQWEHRQDLIYSQIMEMLGRYKEANQYYLMFWERLYIRSNSLICKMS